ncbi:MAG: ion channel [Spirochaetaceae bacterium]|jgi:voltage-gated potassium channel|nr:ion channel [Spirochaetaceae bacterium]
MKTTKKILYTIQKTPYVRPITFFIILFILSGMLVFFAENGKNNHFETFIDGFWWAIITFSTTGYGDKYPITLAGRIIAVITIFFGIAGMSFLSGVFASVFVDRNSRARRGLVDFPKMKDHLIICGWSEEIREILQDIVSFSKTYSSDKIIILSNIPSETIESLKENKKLTEIKFVRGDYFSDTALRRANVTQARKVLILSDSYESNADAEADSKTIMTVMTIRTLSKDVYICAEMINRKYESNLKQAMCDEVLFKRDVSQKILSYTSVENGMGHIFYDLLSQKEDGSRIATREIDNKYIEGSFDEYKQSCSDSSFIILGLLENTGSPNKMKMEALRAAQKTTNVSVLVDNLKDVKDLEVNKPVFAPENEYIIKKHTLAIVLEKINESE